MNTMLSGLQSHTMGKTAISAETSNKKEELKSRTLSHQVESDEYKVDQAQSPQVQIQESLTEDGPRNAGYQEGSNYGQDLLTQDTHLVQRSMDFVTQLDITESQET